MTLPTLRVAFENTQVQGNDGPGFLYLETDNAGKFILTPQYAEADAVFTAVPNPPPMGGDPGGSVLYVQSFESVMDADAVAAMEFGDDWTAKYYQSGGSDGRGYWAVSPKADIKVSSGGNLAVPVSNMKVGDGKVQGSSFTAVVTYFDVGNITSSDVKHRDAHFPIALRNAPDAPSLKKLSDFVTCSFSRGYQMDWGNYDNVQMIRATQADESVNLNSFSLDVAPILGQPTIQVTDSTVFKISFPVAGGPFGAFASSGDLAEMQISSPYGWVVEPYLDVDPPFWQIKIPVGKPISGRLVFDNVATHLEDGFSQILFHWEAVPGCDDGEFWLPIYKYGPGKVIMADACHHREIDDVESVVIWNMDNYTRIVIELALYNVDNGTYSDRQILVDTHILTGNSRFKFYNDGHTVRFSGCPMDSDPAKRVLTEVAHVFVRG